MKTIDKYFSVVVSDKGDAADMLVYGFIGQQPGRWDRDRKEEDITDLAFIRQLNELEQKYSRINIRLNSPGGSIFHGDAIISAIQRSKAEIHTYNDGFAASMAANIWLAAPNRHMSKHAKLMVHNAMTIAIGNAQDLKNEMEFLQKLDESLVGILAESTGKSRDEIRQKYYDYQDHWLLAEDVAELGLIESPEEYAVKEMPKNLQEMTYSDLVNYFSKDEDNEGQGLLTRIANKFFGSYSRNLATASIPKQQNSQEMNIVEFTNSIGTEDLPIEAVVNELRTRNYTVTEPDPEPTEDDRIAAAVDTAVAPLLQQIQNLQQEVQRLGDLPGDAPSNVAAASDTEDGLDVNEKTDAIAALATAAKNGDRVNTLT